MPKRAPTHPCRAPACNQQVPHGRLMCRPHWYRLPAALRSAISATWRIQQLGAWRANVREAERLLEDETFTSFKSVPPQQEHRLGE